jgi:hypothetical protein
MARSCGTIDDWLQGDVLPDLIGTLPLSLSPSVSLFPPEPSSLCQCLLLSRNSAKAKWIMKKRIVRPRAVRRALLHPSKTCLQICPQPPQQPQLPTLPLCLVKKRSSADFSELLTSKPLSLSSWDPPPGPSSLSPDSLLLSSLTGSSLWKTSLDSFFKPLETATLPPPLPLRNSSRISSTLSSRSVSLCLSLPLPSRIPAPPAFSSLCRTCLGRRVI